MFRVALTGGIASGKSTVADIFRKLGVPVIDLDQVARDVVTPDSTGLKQLQQNFGDEIIDDHGALRRDRLRKRIFADAAARTTVNSILHPLILAETEKRLHELRAPYAIVEIPLLAETEMASRYQRVLVVDLPEDLQVERLVKRDRLTETDARAALRAQATRDARLALATEVILNTGSLETLENQVETLHKQYLMDAKRFASAAKRPSE